MELPLTVVPLYQEPLTTHGARTHARLPPPPQVRRVAPGEAVTTHGRRVAAVAVLCAGSLVSTSSTTTQASTAAPRVLPVGHVLGAAELFFPNQGCEVCAPLTHQRMPTARITFLCFSPGGSAASLLCSPLGAKHAS
jgi:hypothetical protein